jgi:hypothetical protein
MTNVNLQLVEPVRGTKPVTLNLSVRLTHRPRYGNNQSLYLLTVTPI